LERGARDLSVGQYLLVKPLVFHDDERFPFWLGEQVVGMSAAL